MMYVNPSSVWYEETWTRIPADSTSTFLLPLLPRSMISFILPSSGASCTRSASSDEPSFRSKALENAPRASLALSSLLAWKLRLPSQFFLYWKSALPWRTLALQPTAFQMVGVVLAPPKTTQSD